MMKSKAPTIRATRYLNFGVFELNVLLAIELRKDVGWWEERVATCSMQIEAYQDAEEVRTKMLTGNEC